MSRADPRPRLAFVGPMLGRVPGWVPNPAEVLGPRLAEAGYAVRYTSRQPNRLLRLLDMLRSIWAWRKQVDVFVLAVYSGPAFWMADLPSRWIRRLGKRQVFVLHGGNLPEFSRGRERWLKRVLDRADAIVSPSGYLADFFAGWGYAARVIPNLLNLADYPYRGRSFVEPKLFWMRTFSPTYHPELAVRALALVRAEQPAATLTMAGQDRGLQADVQRLAAELGLGDAVRFPGFLSPEAKGREFAAADIYLHTNRVDNMPVSVVEAWAYGLPVIGTRVGGMPFLVDHEVSGLLVPDDDAAAMAQAVLRLISEPALAAQLSKYGRAQAERCDWPVVRAQWEALFNTLSDSR